MSFSQQILKLKHTHLFAFGEIPYYVIMTKLRRILYVILCTKLFLWAIKCVIQRFVRIKKDHILKVTKHPSLKYFPEKNMSVLLLRIL